MAISRNFLALTLAAGVVVSLTACSVPTSNNGNSAASSTEVLTDAQLRAALVKSLREDCTSLNEFVLTPSNWETVSTSPTSSQFSLYGDGGTLSLNVIPDGVGGANVAIADSDHETTNILLYNSGCKTLATAPLDSGNDNSVQQGGTQNSGHNEQRCTQVQVPNPQWDPYAGPGVMAMKGINQFMYEQQCQWVWVNG